MPGYGTSRRSSRPRAWTGFDPRHLAGRGRCRCLRGSASGAGDPTRAVRRLPPGQGDAPPTRPNDEPTSSRSTSPGWAGATTTPAFRQVFTAQFMPEGSRELWEEFNELQRQTTSAENAAQVLRVSGSIDVVDIAPQVQAPTLVLHARNDRRPPFEQGRMMADLIPNSRFVPSRAATTCCSRTSLPGQSSCPRSRPSSRSDVSVWRRAAIPARYTCDGVHVAPLCRGRAFPEMPPLRPRGRRPGRRGSPLPVHDLRLVLAHAVR